MRLYELTTELENFARIRRADWPRHKTLALDPDRQLRVMMGDHYLNDWNPTPQDLTATDWHPTEANASEAQRIRDLADALMSAWMQIQAAIEAPGQWKAFALPRDMSRQVLATLASTFETLTLELTAHSGTHDRIAALWHGAPPPAKADQPPSYLVPDKDATP